MYFLDRPVGIFSDPKLVNDAGRSNELSVEHSHYSLDRSHTYFRRIPSMIPKKSLLAVRVANIMKQACAAAELLECMD